MPGRGRPFEKGNKFGRGRPPGSRNQVAFRVQALFEEHAEALVRKCMHMALTGDPTALRLCMERVLPACKDLPVKVARMRGRTADEITKTLEMILKRVSSGKLTPHDAQTIGNLLETRRRAIETEEHEARLRALEQAHETR